MHYVSLLEKSHISWEMYTGSYNYIANHFLKMVLSVTFSLGPQTAELCNFHSVTPPFQTAPSFAAPFVDKFTEHKHFLTVDVLGFFSRVLQKPDWWGLERVGSCASRTWFPVLLGVTFIVLYLRCLFYREGGHAALTLCISCPPFSVTLLQHSSHISPSVWPKNC